MEKEIKWEWSLLSLVLHLMYSPFFILAFLLDGLDGRWNQEHVKCVIWHFIGFEIKHEKVS